MKKNYKQAFSLIELMVVITIVGILAAIAVPSYKSYIKQTKATELLNSVFLPIKNDIAAAYVQNGAFPTSYLGSSTSSTWVSYPSNPNVQLVYFITGTGSAVIAIDISTTYVDLRGAGSTYNRMHGGFKIINDALVWYCGNWTSVDADVKYLPSGCNTPNIKYILES